MSRNHFRPKQSYISGKIGKTILLKCKKRVKISAADRTVFCYSSWELWILGFYEWNKDDVSASKLLEGNRYWEMHVWPCYTLKNWILFITPYIYYRASANFEGPNYIYQPFGKDEMPLISGNEALSMMNASRLANQCWWVCLISIF